MHMPAHAVLLDPDLVTVVLKHTWEAFSHSG